MLVANLILEAEFGLVWQKFTLKERNKMRVLEAKQKQVLQSPGVVIGSIALDAYTQAVESFADLIAKNPNMSYEEIFAHPLANFEIEL
jgi:hypothetical protein